MEQILLFSQGQILPLTLWVWYFEITAALKIQWLTWLVGGEASWGSEVTLSREEMQPRAGGSLRIHFQAAQPGCSKRHPARSSSLWTGTDLSDATCPMQTNPFLVLCPSDSRPAPKAVTWASEHHWKTGEPWTGKWIWKQLCTSQSRKHRLVYSSKLSKVTTNEYLQNQCYFLSPSLYFPTFWVTQW